VPDIFTLTNLDFEYELAGRTLPPAVSERWRHVLRVLPEAREAQCLDPAAPEPVPGRLLPWGVTPRVVALAPRQEFPDPAVVREVNDKRFSHELERRLGIALPYARVVTTLEELESAVQECPHDWVLKHPFGVSARERAVGKAGRLSDSGRGWARRQLQTWSLVFEPWVEPRSDFSLHFDVGRGGEVCFVGHCQLVADPGGVYRGNRVEPGAPVPNSVWDRAHEAVAAVAGRGYWGPVGLDAFTGSLAGEPVVRPLVEINARFTFGRLTLALRDWLPEGWSLLWSHPREPVSGYPPWNGEATPGTFGLPPAMDPEGISGTFVDFTAP